jgi:hypothetical protein
VETGAILINGVIRILASTTNLNFADNTSGSTRIDRVVARLNLTDRKIELAVVQGTPGAGAPALTRTATVHEMSLAQVALANGYSTIEAGQITDEREDVDACGYFRYRGQFATQEEAEEGLDEYAVMSPLRTKQAITANTLRVITGSFTGNGAADRFISIGHTPYALFVGQGGTGSSTQMNGLVFGPVNMGFSKKNSNVETVVGYSANRTGVPEIVTDGFYVSYTATGQQNANGVSYSWWALV